MKTLPLRTLQTGSEDPPAEYRELSAGPLSLRYEHAGLRNIRFGTREAVRRVGLAVRDRNWNAVPFRVGGLQHESGPDGFSVSFLAESTREDLPLRFRGWIRGSPKGVLTFTLDADPPRALAVTRIGLSVLLPIKELAGRPCAFERVNGAITRGSFPRYVQPHAIADEVRALAYEVAPGVRVRLKMEGDSFELEDVRNWTDAAYELYTPAARLALPFEIKEGTPIRQSFTLTIDGPSNVSRIDPVSTSVSVGAAPLARLPRLGLGSASHGRALGPAELARLKALRPGHLRVDVRPSEPQAAGQLRRAAAEAKSAGCPLEIAVHLVDKGPDELKALVAQLAPLNPPIVQWIVYHDREPVPSERFIVAAREILLPFRPEARIASGTNAFFSDLNRHRPPKAAELLAFSASPQVHAQDPGTFFENLEGLASAIESARLLPGDRPVVVSPITLRPRFNPNATGPENDTPSGELPARVDPRQLSLMGAAWTAGALRAVAQTGVHSVTFYETTGRQGVMEREIDPPLHPRFPCLPGWTFPLYHVLADAADFAGGSVLPWILSRDLVLDGVGLLKDGRVRILLANLTSQNQKARLACPLFKSPVLVRRLDETTAMEAITRPAEFRANPGEITGAGDGPLELELLPYAVVRIDNA